MGGYEYNVSSRNEMGRLGLDFAGFRGWTVGRLL
jgi:hypothetical protein